MVVTYSSNKFCYRGHKYCSVACRKSGYESRRKIARKRYSSSLEALADHRDRNKIYRIYGRQYSTVMDKSSDKDQVPVASQPEDYKIKKLLTGVSIPEIDEKKLVVIDSQSAGASNYGVWWLRNRKTIEPLALKMKDWLETIKL